MEQAAKLDVNDVILKDDYVKGVIANCLNFILELFLLKALALVGEGIRFV